MSTTNCNACNDLRQYAPEFVTNGVTDGVASSLRGNRGFNSSLTVPHNNCEDLNNANDCLIARMDSEVEAYEVCDWKEFMHKFLPNNYEMLKAMIASDCGQWNILGGMCELIQQLVQPTFDEYGIRTGSNMTGKPQLEGGEIVEGRLIQATPSLWDGIGFHYVKRNIVNCSGGSTTYEWLYPWIRNYRIADGVEYGATLYRVPVSRVTEWGWSNSVIDLLARYQQWRQGYGNAFGLQESATIQFMVEDNYLVLKYMGSTGSMNGRVIDQEIRDPLVIIS